MKLINYWSKYIVSILALLTVFRIIFFFLHFSGNNINLNAIIISLLHGIRFDLSALAYLFIPIWGVYIFLSLPSFNQKSFLLPKPLIKLYLSLLIILFTIIHIIDIGFFYEFNTRINYLAFEYLSYFDSTLGTIIAVFPYNVLFISILLLIIIEILFLMKKLYRIPIYNYNKYTTWVFSSIFFTSFSRICSWNCRRWFYYWRWKCSYNYYRIRILILQSLCGFSYQQIAKPNRRICWYWQSKDSFQGFSI